jgi:hypothetical protein
MPEQRQENDDRDWDAQQPKQNAFAETHFSPPFSVVGNLTSGKTLSSARGKNSAWNGG